MIYADYAATTPVHPLVFREMEAWFCRQWANPSSVHAAGREARQAVEKARARVASALGAKPEEIFFTSGGTEADNWAISGAMELAENGDNGRNRSVVTSSIEHHAVLKTCETFGRHGAKITLMPVHADGLVDLDRFPLAVKAGTGLVSIMLANNEIGTIQPVAEIAALSKARGVLCHTDAVQAVGHIPVDVQDLGVDLLSLSAHKAGGPKGVGALYIRAGTPLPALLHGGSQEGGLRAGTENVPGIVALGMAIELAVQDLERRMTELQEMRDHLVRGLLALGGVDFNGNREKLLPGTASLTFDGCLSASLLPLLDRSGIAASGGSACNSASSTPSHVLTAIGLDDEAARSTIRFSLGDETRNADIDTIIRETGRAVGELRKAVPIWAR